jgi:hypothetical protein
VKETAWRCIEHGGEQHIIIRNPEGKKAIWKTQMYREEYTTVSSRNVATKYGLDSSDSGQRQVLFSNAVATKPSCFIHVYAIS